MAIEEVSARPAAEPGGHVHASTDGLPMIRAAMDESFAGVMVTDAAGVIEHVNRSFETTSGYCAAELIGRPIAGLSADDDLEKSIGAALSAGGQWRGEIKNKRPDGEEFCMLASIQPLRSDDGEITHYIGVSIDITERVKVEEELAESEAHWRALVENAPDYIFAVDRDGVITSLNWSARGATADGAVSRTVYDFVREEYHDVWRERLAEVFAGGRQAEFEVRLIGGTGDAQWYANSLGAVYKGGTVVGAITVSRNVTARKKAEAELAESEAYWRALVENAPDHILTVDKDGVFTSLNWSLPGITVDDVVGGTVYDWTHVESHDAWRQALAKVFAGTGRVEFETRTFDEDAQAQWYASTLGAVYEGGAVVAGIAIIRDITALKEAEEQMQRLREETEAEAEEGVKRASEYGLTFREITVLSLIAQGKSDKEAAVLLGLSPFTVNKHSSNLIHKMGAGSRSQAAARAVREGII